MAKFKCRVSGVVVEFIHPVDIETTRANPAYDEVKDVPNGVQVKEKQDTKKEVKKTVKVEE